jgi:hypothetical protein
MVYLKIEGGITVYFTEVNTLGASDAFILFNIVFPVGVFDKNTLNGISGADLIFCSRGEFIVFRVKISKTIPAIAADGIGLDALYCRRGHHTMSLTKILRFAYALCTFCRVKLPNGVFTSGTKGSQSAN